MKKLIGPLGYSSPDLPSKPF